VLAGLALIAALHWARDFLIPVITAFFLAYTLQPMVNRLAAARVPRGLGVALVLGVLVGGLTFAVASLRDDAVTSLENLPAATRKLSDALLGLASWGCYGAIVLEHAPLWVIVAAVLHLIPYLGPVLGAGITGVAAFMHFESLSMAALVTAVALALASLVGMFIVPMLSGRQANMNPTANINALLFFGWLWGTWGLLLGIPLAVICKVVAERVDGLSVVAELLRDCSGARCAVRANIARAAEGVTHHAHHITTVSARKSLIVRVYSRISQPACELRSQTRTALRFLSFIA
jgi:predicted PurR-regulated permease PerM